MNLIDILVVFGIGAVLWGIKDMLASLIDAFGTPREYRERGYKDLRPFAGFGKVLIGWFLSLIALGGAVKIGTSEYLYMTTAIVNATNLAVLLSGALLAILVIVMGVRFTLQH